MSQTRPDRRTTQEAAPDRRRWLALTLLVASFFMVIVDSQIVMLALPSIEQELGFAPGGVQWVMSAYLLSFGGLLMFGGRTADLLGGRRMFLFGTALFGVASVLCGLAWTDTVLVAARVVQGVAAAVMTPTAMAVLMHTFAEGPERNKALGIWTGVGAFGATAALLIGGPITDGLGWEWIFYINVPVVAVVLLFGPRLLKQTPVREGRRRFDPAGAVTVTAAIAMLVYAVSEAPLVGWGSGQTIGLLVAAVVLFVVFTVIEHRSQAPLVPLRIFRSPTVVGGNVLMLIVAMAVYGGALITSLYAQQVLGYSAVRFGLSTAVYAVMSIIGANVSARLVARVGYKPIAIVGMSLLFGGLLLLTRIDPDGGYWSDLFFGLVVFGSGIGSTNVAASIASLTGAKAEESGLVSGINNAVFQIGAALGIAIASSVAFAYTTGTSPEALNDGFQAGFAATAVFALAGLATALLLLLNRDSGRPAGPADPAGDEEAAKPVLVGH
ncbi:MFS transporter [Actinomadura kijaniata]|uniref:EmrB/QacA subfamily drug resistance transporter n=1 Tax=Actinomadura namibiensis TaxID=182080 RepID=A0A7W3QPR8_ACTNM|nr:MFS transporter [Actinomadura namibiensis]MBA8954851.1 EmrB/QacA subfamily drug resistance transporter [Actinomadura namibiensis]